MKIGIAGLGVVGGTLYRWLGEHTSHELSVYDPPIGRVENLSECDAMFLCVPVPTGVGLQQDLKIVDEVLRLFGTPRQRIFMRSSVLPGTCDSLREAYGLNVFAMPEFLTERTAYASMLEQSVLCGGKDEGVQHYKFLMELLACKKEIILMSNAEAEMAKYMHNGNGTVKVAFNNKIYALCEKMGLDYNLVRAGALMSGYIGEHHTRVPGPDGMVGYGGKCFPKDMDALIGLMHANGVHCASLEEMQKENKAIRRPKVLENEPREQTH